MPAAGMLGKLPPHPESTHPRVKLANHLTASALPGTPMVVDYASRVRTWPMYLNDQLGDCTCAGIGHSVQAWTAYGKGEVTLPDSAILNLYERMGYIPDNPGTDQGAVEQDVLAEVQKNGIGRHKILAYAQVDHTNLNEMKTALNLFGSVYLGAQMPQSAMTQTEAGQPWGIGPGNPNWSERVESGLISFGGDTDGQTNPYEVRMGKYVDLHVPDDTVGIQALRRIAEEGPKRHSLGIILDAGDPVSPGFLWNPIYKDGVKVGDLTNCVFSIRVQKNLGFALISRDCVVGDRVQAMVGGVMQSGVLTELPFV